LNHFYFQFDADKDYSIEAIYYHFPYLSYLLDEEQVKADCFLSIVLDKQIFELTQADYELQLPIQLFNKTSKLTNCAPGVWKFTGFYKFFSR
jgi:hypothetical protein